MLQNLVYTFEIIDADLPYTKIFVNSTKSRCNIYIAELQNILKNYENFLENITSYLDN